MLLDAEHPVISVNGNVAALSAGDIKELSDELGCRVEVNIFHRTKERVDRLISHMKDNGIEDVLGKGPDARIPGLDHARSFCCREGIFSADVILVPLEDGDRCQALRDMGKKVITIDLNPLSRTARTASITIVDNIIRALPLIKEKVREFKDLDHLDVADFDNESNLLLTLRRITKRF
jgi:4-phosphopantoate--beta-alanine ligase